MPKTTPRSRRRARPKPARELNFKRIARAAHKNIVDAVAHLETNWAEIARKCREFQERRYFTAITNPDTEKPFRSFAQWAKHVFGKSRSQVFGATKILRELGGKTTVRELGEMTQQNARHLARLERAGIPVTPDLKKKAAEMTELEFLPQVEALLPKEQRSPYTAKLGPYAVTPKTAGKFTNALRVAEADIGDEIQPARARRDAALALIADDFTGSRELEQVDEAAKRRPPARAVTVPAKEVAR